jgi:O-antigen ligase
MTKAEWLRRSLEYSLCAVAFSLPLLYSWCSAAVFITIFIWFFQFNPKLTFANLKKRKALWMWMIFFILHSIGFLYSQDKAQANWDLGSKVCFFMFPIVFGAGMTISELLLEKILFSYLLGVSITAIYCITHSALEFIKTGSTSYFFYNNLIQGLDTNAVGESLHTIFGIAILFFYKWKYIFQNRILRILLAILQILFLILLSSKTLIALFFIILMPIYIYRLYSKLRFSFTYIIGVIFLTITISLLIFKTNNPIKERYNDVISSNLNVAWKDSLKGPINFNNLSLRLFLWRLGFENIREHNLWWYGAGIGDVHKLQNYKMYQHGIGDIYSKEHRSELYNVNLHNMYIETLMMLGIPGLCCLLIILFQPFFYYRYFDSQLVYCMFFFIAIVYMCQESALQSQSGRIYYTLFSVIFLNRIYSNKENKLV